MELIKCKEKLRKAEEHKRMFRKCKRCLIANQNLLDEEKKKLLVSLEVKKKKWKEESLGRKSKKSSPEMSKILFSENSIFKNKIGEYLKRRKLKTPLASTKGLNSLVKMSCRKKKNRILTEEYKDSNLDNNKNKFCKEIIPESRNELEKFMITPRIEREDYRMKKMEMNQYFSNKNPDKFNPLSASNSDYCISVPHGPNKQMNRENNTYQDFTDTSNFKSFTTFLSYPKSHVEKELEHDIHVQIPSKLSNKLDKPKPKISKKKKSVSKGKKKISKSVKLKGLGQNHNLTLREEKALKKLLYTLRSDSKPKIKKKKRVKKSLDVWPKKKMKKSTRGKKESCLRQLMKKDEMRRLICKNLIKKKV
jgi:hypothetical protein